jgi:hypothetical protein
MTWLIWRQHRVQLAIAAIVLVAFAIPVWITGRHLTSELAACRAGATCGDLFDGLHGINTVVDLTLMVPLLVGVFWGATIIGRELEAGTVALVWTQTVTSRRWLAIKLVTLFGFTVLVASADAGLVSWWSNTHNALVESRFAGLQFDIQGVVPVGYALFASALGLAAGIAWRRNLPAMATTVGGFIGARLIVELIVRPHYLSPVVARYSMKQLDPTPPGSMSISTELLQHGHVVNGPIRVECGGALSREQMSACMQRLGYQVRSTYQPANRYWTFQWIEFGIFAALAVVLVAVALVVLRRRDV